MFTQLCEPLMLLLTATHVFAKAPAVLYATASAMTYSLLMGKTRSCLQLETA